MSYNNPQVMSMDQDLWATPQDIITVVKNRGGLYSWSLKDQRTPDSLIDFREALGFRENDPEEIDLQFQRVSSGKQSSSYRFPKTVEEKFGKGLFIIGFRDSEYKDSKTSYTGPIGFEQRDDRDSKIKSPQLSGIKILNVQKILWPFNDRGYSYRQLSKFESWRGNAIGVQVEYEGQRIWCYLSLLIAEYVFGVIINKRGRLSVGDQEFETFPNLSIFCGGFDYNYQATSKVFDFTMEDYYNQRNLSIGDLSLNNMLYAQAQLNLHTSTDDLKKSGLNKLYKKTLSALAQELYDNGELLYWMALRTIFLNGNKSIRKVKTSVIINQEFKDITTREALKEKLQVFLTEYASNKWGAFEKALSSFDFFSTKRKEAVRRDTSKAIRTRVQDLDEVELDKVKFPLTYEALINGEIPLTCLFPSQETYFLTNDNWDLWERMLSRFPEETKKCAVEAGARRNYERDLMSYFYFVLDALPEYLEKHTGYTWTCSPRLVASQYELEPQAVEEDRGVIKKRSAMTPVANNKTHHVVVPYCSMAVHGRMTTYCYAHNYQVLHRGMVFDGNVVTTDIEEKLNGKDDYGLMYNTLTGSYTNRGYPTFLIIFERLKKGKKTRVHFHRVHPMRSKSGDRNPVSNWTKVAYNWMIGNVNKDNIAFQQGDLAFIRVEEPKAGKIDFEESVKVTDCDSHCFTTPVDFVEYTGKINHILGYIRVLKKGVKLEHTEHDNVSTKVGVFEIRQARSWEANPKGIWTLNFD